MERGGQDLGSDGRQMKPQGWMRSLDSALRLALQAFRRNLWEVGGAGLGDEQGLAESSLPGDLMIDS